MRRTLLASVILAFAALSTADEPKEKPKPPEQTDKSEPAGFKTVETAVTAKVQPRGTTAGAGQTGYLGLYVQTDSKGKLAVEQVGTDSPAAKAGFQVGDEVLKVEGQTPATRDEFRGLLQAKAPGEKVSISISRKGKEMELTATLVATSKPMKLSGQQVGLGIRLAEGDEGGGFKVDTVNADSPAAKAGVKVGDHLVKIEGAAVTTRGSINDLLADKKVGDVVLLSLKRDGKDVEVRATLAAEQGGGGRQIGRAHV